MSDVPVRHLEWAAFCAELARRIRLRPERPGDFDGVEGLIPPDFRLRPAVVIDPKERP